MTINIYSSSSDQTEKIGEQIGLCLKGGEVVDLKSDLGGGKTTIVRGMVKGAGSTDKVASPSFTISRVYKTDKLKIHHFDFYRLTEPGLMSHHLKDVLADPKASTMVEWSDIVSEELPKDRLSINIRVKDDDSRELIFNYPKSLAYLVGRL